MRRTFPRPQARRGPLGAALLLTLAGVGCGGDRILMPGSLEAPLVRYATSADAKGEETPRLTARESGDLVLVSEKAPGRGEAALDVPVVRERARFGIALVDAADLPLPLRPAHARAGGALVTAVRKASPLAVAGLRPFDVVTSLDGRPVAGPAALVDALAAIPEGRALRLGVTRLSHRGTDDRFLRDLVSSASMPPLTIAARAGGPLSESSSAYAPFLFEVERTVMGAKQDVGPFAILLSRREVVGAARDVEALDLFTLRGEDDGDVYVRRHEWSVLWGLVSYCGDSTRTGREVETAGVPLEDERARSTLRLLWVIPIRSRS